jgi:hypothetical protein
MSDVETVCLTLISLGSLALLGFIFWMVFRHG